MRNKVMEIVYGILSFFSVIAVVAVMFVTIFFGMPRFMDWVDLNLDKNYMENRAERKVKDLKRQIRITDLENEAAALEKKIAERNEK